MKTSKLLLILLALVLALSACQGDKQGTTDAKPSLEVAYRRVLDQELLPAMVLLDEDDGLDYLGIDGALSSEQVLAVSADGLRADSLLMFQAKDSASLASLESALKARLVALGDEARTYSPEQFAIIQDAKILKDGLYIALLISPQVAQLEEAYKAAFK